MDQITDEELLKTYWEKYVNQEFADTDDEYLLTIMNKYEDECMYLNQLFDTNDGDEDFFQLIMNNHEWSYSGLGVLYRF